MVESSHPVFLSFRRLQYKIPFAGRLSIAIDIIRHVERFIRRISPQRWPAKNYNVPVWSIPSDPGTIASGFICLFRSDQDAEPSYAPVDLFHLFLRIILFIAFVIDTFPGKRIPIPGKFLFFFQLLMLHILSCVGIYLHVPSELADDILYRNVESMCSFFRP